MCKADDAPVASLELSATRKAPADAPDPPAATAPSSTGRLGRLLGPVLLVTGALMFASANASAKVLYTHGAVNIISIFLLRSLVVYLMNAALVFAGVGGAPRSAVAGVLLLRAGSRRTHMLTLMRSLLGAGGIVTLNISFAAFLTFADAFAIFLGLATMLSILGARFLLGASERSSWRVLLGGIATVVGIVFVTQPSAIFGAVDAEPPSAVGVAVAVAAAVLISGFSLLTRLLSRTGPAATALVSPALLLSYYMVVLGCCASVAMIGARLLPGETPSWARLVLPTCAKDWACYFGYCALILLGQLLNAFGMGRTLAGVGAILMVTELPFAYLVDVFVLQEPTNALASVGAAVVFVGVAYAAGEGKPKAKTETAPLSGPAAAVSPEEGHAPEDWLATVEVPAKADASTTSTEERGVI